MFPNYHITETIPFDSYAACQVVVLQQQKSDYNPFRFQIITSSNDGSIEADKATIKPDIQVKCETYKVDNKTP
jgi:hypothetical protein